MNPHMIRRLFPGASASVLAANAADYGLGDQSNQAIPASRMPVKAPEPLKPTHDSGMAAFVIPGAPIGKPRMTRRDKWKKRPCVLRYREWADSARAAVGDIRKDPLTVSWTAYLPMPASWSRKKREAHRGTLHRQKPDRDNIDKAVLDSLFKSDCGVAGGTLVKRWDDGRGARIEIEITFA